jgi:hypothetical protein
MKASAYLMLDFNSYWHAGSGRSQGYHLDALTEMEQGLPVLPGRQLKGVLRNAIHRAEAWGWLDEIHLQNGPLSSHEELLFGSRSQSESRDATSPGLMQIDTARLPDPDRTWLSQPDQVEVSKVLFEELFSTAINELGSAKRYSLRGIEVSIPLSLEAQISLIITAVCPQLRH